MPALSPADAAKELVARRLGRENLLGFTKYTHPRWVTGPHHARMCAALDDVITGRLKRLIITAAPRGSKSELCTRRLPPLFMGRYPNRQIITACYGSDLAHDMGRDVREVIRDPYYLRLFPEIKLAADTRAAGRWRTNHGGIYISAGVGGPIVGRGFHCVAKGCRVLTARGLVPIELVRPGMYVWTHRQRWRRVIAVANNGVRDVVRLTGNGSQIICTPDHKILTEEGWKHGAEAKVAVGVDMQGVRQGLRVEMEGQKREVLLPRLQSQVDKQEMGGAPAVVRLVRGIDQEPLKQNGLLHAQVLQRGAESDGQRHYAQGQAVSGVRGDFSPGITPDNPLLGGVCERGSLKENGWQEQSELQARQNGWGAYQEIQGAGVVAGGGVSRVRGVQPAGPSASSPYRREQAQQRLGEPCCDLQHMSRKISQVKECGAAEVYDIQVEEDRSFAVEGFFAHNCGIIDDPHKGRKEADSALLRNRVWEWYWANFYTRRMPDLEELSRVERERLTDADVSWGSAAIALVMTRWHKDDLAGRLLKHEGTVEEGGSWTVIEIPAINNEDTEDESSFWPRAFPLTELRETRHKMRTAGRSREWTAQYQQHPTSEEGTYIQRDWFKGRYTEKPDKMRVYIASDYAITDENEGTDPNYTEHGVFGIAPSGGLYVLDWWYGRTESDVWVEKLLDLVAKWKPHCVFGEKGQIVKSIGPYLRRRKKQRRVRFRMETINRSEDKAASARGFQAMASSGDVLFPRTEWAQRVIDQSVEFPGGEYDDAFDVMALMCMAIDMAHPAIAYSKQSTELEKPRDRWRVDSNQTSWKSV